MKCARWSPVVVAVASMVFLLAGCDAKRESAESIIPKLYWGRYTGTQLSYEMRDENSNVIVFNGKTMPVPAIKNNVEIDGAGITWQQEAQFTSVTEMATVVPVAESSNNASLPSA